jgi:hypothetical protein
MALKVAVGFEERAAVEGAKKISKSLEDVDKQLDTIGKNKSLDEVEASMKDAERASDDTGKKIGKNLDDGFHKAGDGAKDFKQEANSTARETAASFDGSAESIGDAFQEVAANAFGAFGPAAGLAGLAVAAGIGGIKTTFDELAEKSKEVKEGIITDFIEVGDALDREAVDARVRDLLGNENTRKQAQLLADILDVDLASAVLALAGDFDSAGVTMEDAFKGVEGAQSDVDFQTWLELKNTMEATNAAFEVGTALAKAREDAATRTGDTERSQIQRTSDADQTRWELYAAARADAEARAANPIVQSVELQDNTDYYAFRSAILANIGTIRPNVQLGPGVGQVWEP